MRIFKSDFDIDEEIKELSKDGFSSEAQILSFIKRHSTVEITDEQVGEQASLCMSKEDEYAFLSCWNYIKITYKSISYEQGRQINSR